MSSGFWESAARTDPLWAILSDPAKRDRRWTLREFFQTGRREISLLLHQLRTLGYPASPGAAMDFGCGVGRLTQALAPAFASVTGVDVSPTMIRLAGRLNRFPDRVRYLLNERPDLSLLATSSLDFIYSDIVLQHLPPELSRIYVREFLRTLRGGGLVVFQLTAEHRGNDVPARRVGAMPDAAYRVRIEVEGLPADMPPDGEIRVMVSVTNLSTEAWDAQRYGVLRVGNHWLESGGAMLIQDDGRTEIAGGLPPGEQRRLPLTIKAPSAPGYYICEIDAVHEGVTWFADRASPAWRGQVRVGAATGAAARRADASDEENYPDISGEIDATAQPIAEFPMYGIPRDEVVTNVEAAGGHVFHVEPDERGGPEWSGYRYFVRRRPD